MPPCLPIPSILPSSNPQSSALAVLITMMAPSNMDHPIPPNLSLVPTPNLLSVTLRSHKRSSQRQDIPDPFSPHISIEDPCYHFPSLTILSLSFLGHPAPRTRCTLTISTSHRSHCITSRRTPPCLHTLCRCSIQMSCPIWNPGRRVGDKRALVSQQDVVPVLLPVELNTTQPWRTRACLSNSNGPPTGSYQGDYTSSHQGELPQEDASSCRLYTKPGVGPGTMHRRRRRPSGDHPPSDPLRIRHINRGPDSPHDA